MTVYEFLDAYPVTLVKTMAPTALTNYEIHVVVPDHPRSFKGPTGAEIREGGHLSGKIIVQNHPATWPYDQVPRFWRQRMFPDGFERWTEAEHAAKGSPYTWPQQEIVWARREVAEAWMDGDIDVLERDRLLAEMEPAPQANARLLVARLAKRMTVRPQAERKAPPDEVLLAGVSPVPEPQAAETAAA